MSQKLGYHITDNLKEEYEEFIIDEFGYKRNRCGSEVENALKFYLAANGNSKYQNDPDVQAIFEKAKETFQEKPETPEPIPENIEEKMNELKEHVNEKFDTMKEELLAQFEKKARREVSKRHGLADFKKQFKMTFQDNHQVSRKDLEHFIMNQADIVDNRSIQGRIQYLLANEVLEPYAPNIYNIKIG